MKNNFKLLSVMSMIGVMTLGVTGCSNVKKGSVVEPNVISISKLKERYTENNPIQINFWTGFGKDITEGLDQIIADFEADTYVPLPRLLSSKPSLSSTLVACLTVWRLIENFFPNSFSEGNLMPTLNSPLKICSLIQFIKSIYFGASAVAISTPSFLL